MTTYYGASSYTPGYQEFGFYSLAPGARQTAWLTVAARADDSFWRLPVLAVRGVEEGPALLVLAGVHGDEYEGIEAIPQVYHALDPEQVRGTLVMLPVCNLPAYEAAQRSSPVDGLNLARVFPGQEDGSLTARIADAILHRVLRYADFLVDLHSSGSFYNIPTLVGYVHDAGELGQRSLAAAGAFGAPVLWGHPLPLPPGRTISAAMELGIPSLYTEAPGGGYARPEDVACFRRGVLNLMRHLEMLPGPIEAEDPTHHLVGDGDLDTVITSPTAGYFRAQVELLETVEPGQPLGAIYDFFGEVRAEVTAPTGGVVIMLRRYHRVHTGDGLAHLTLSVTH